MSKKYIPQNGEFPNLIKQKYLKQKLETLNKNLVSKILIIKLLKLFKFEILF